jgi:hypothetical protein
MIFGHNSNVKVGDLTFHVQTEDRGEGHALIDTTVYHRGRVLHRRTSNYYDLMPLDADRRQALKLRLDEQHRVVLEEIRSGKIELKVPEPPKPPARVPAVTPALAPAAVAVAPQRLSVELLNARNWLNGKHASLHLAVKQSDGTPVQRARVVATIEGAESAQVHSGEVNDAGEVTIEFEMPRISSSEAALLIHAQNEQTEGHLRFALRAKPRVPSV